MTELLHIRELKSFEFNKPAAWAPRKAPPTGLRASISLTFWNAPDCQSAALTWMQLAVRTCPVFSVVPVALLLWGSPHLLLCAQLLRRQQRNNITTGLISHTKYFFSVLFWYECGKPFHKCAFFPFLLMILLKGHYSAGVCRALVNASRCI